MMRISEAVKGEERGGRGGGIEEKGLLLPEGCGVEDKHRRRCGGQRRLRISEEGAEEGFRESCSLTCMIINGAAGTTSRQTPYSPAARFVSAHAAWVHSRWKG